MSRSPFRSESRGNVFILTLDTPGAEVNVLTREAAADLTAALAHLPPEVGAVVLRSAKPRSFVNGVGLLIAGAVKTVENVAALTKPARDAYRALKDCRVPTIAAIDGNCYGCGVELSLQCDYRLAVDSFDTHFRMTELADYLFLPTFGATQDLPPLLGLDAAADFVLWGGTLTARQARDVGLVDDCVLPSEFDAALSRTLDRLLSAGASSPRLARRDSPDVAARGVAARRVRIARLPDAYRSIYSTAVELMVAGVEATAPRSELYEREAAQAAKSLLGAPCRGAWPFFFIRQMARTRAMSLASTVAPGELRLDAADANAEAFAAEVTRRCVPPALSGAEGRSPPEPLRIRVRSYRGEGGPAEGEIGVADCVDGDPVDRRWSTVLYGPLRAAGIDLVEVARTGNGGESLQPRVASLLAQARAFTVLPTRPQGRFVLDELLAAWLRPQLAYLAAGGERRTLAATLRAFGFTFLAGDLFKKLPDAAVARLPALLRGRAEPSARAIDGLPTVEDEDGSVDATVIDAVLVSLTGFALRALGDGSAGHPTTVDVLARDAIDFPLQYTSLCRYVTRRRASELVDASARVRDLVLEDDLSKLVGFISRGKEHYGTVAHR
jgi:enoyl-CoA hydratase/carnithine racemase